MFTNYLKDFLGYKSMEFQGLMPRFLAANDFYPIAPAIELFSQKYNERFIRG